MIGSDKKKKKSCIMRDLPSNSLGHSFNSFAEMTGYVLYID